MNKQDRRGRTWIWRRSRKLWNDKWGQKPPSALL